MKKITQWLAMAGIATLCLGVGNLAAQDQGGPTGPGGQGGPGGGRGPGGRGGGNFDPAQFQQRMNDRIKEQFGSTDEEWNAIQPLVQKVMDLRREQIGANMRGFGRGGRGFGRNNEDVQNEQTALNDAVENNASKDELKEKMAAFRKARDAKEKELKAAQDSLKKVLTTKQEAIALQMGLVK